jgi:hypothetical protein
MVQYCVDTTVKCMQVDAHFQAVIHAGSSASCLGNVKLTLDTVATLTAQTLLCFVQTSLAGLACFQAQRTGSVSNVQPKGI